MTVTFFGHRDTPDAVIVYVSIRQEAQQPFGNLHCEKVNRSSTLPNKNKGTSAEAPFRLFAYRLSNSGL